MDQRVDNERRTESAPVGEAGSTAGTRQRKRSWHDTFRERRMLVVAIAAISAIMIVATVSEPLPKRGLSQRFADRQR